MKQTMLLGTAVAILALGGCDKTGSASSSSKLQQPHSAQMQPQSPTAPTIVGEWVCKRINMSGAKVIQFLADGRFAETLKDPGSAPVTSTGTYSIDGLELILDYGDVRARWFVATEKGESVVSTPTNTMGMSNPLGGRSAMYACARSS